MAKIKIQKFELTSLKTQMLDSKLETHGFKLQCCIALIPDQSN